MRYIEIFEETDEYAVAIISSDNQQCLQIDRYLPTGAVIPDSASGNYANAHMLSEAFRDAVGYGPALDILVKHGLPEDDPLMTLGRKG